MELSISIKTSLHNMPYIIKKSISDFSLKSYFNSHTYNKPSVESYLKEVIDWVLRAQRTSNCGGGIPAGYALYGGYKNPYPETSGYMITSLINSYCYFQDESYKKAAVNIAEWLIKRQLENGAIRCNIEPPATQFINSSINDSKIYLFDCGAILDGLISLWKKVPDDRYKSTAIRLADYMISNQEDNGLWRKDLFFPYLGAHQTRTMWALINAGKAFNKSEYIESALKCLNKLKTNIKQNGYITDCHFTHAKNGNFAFTHPIAYAIEGFLKAGTLLDVQEYSSLATDVAYKLKIIAENRQEIFFSHYDPKWISISNYQCVTGNIQIAMIWLEMAKCADDDTLIYTAIKFLEFIRNNMIDIRTKIAGVRGGIPGSFPIYGKYMPYTFINWGAKFFIDASLLELQLNARMEN